jgi:2-dehydro-3-deoxyphosphogluconate aldolase/(4S)-4-hydroxy-2-oxoglutarate aldolase
MCWKKEVYMVRKLLEKQRVIPVLTLENIEDGYFIARLLKRYDFKLLEITLRNPFALDIAKGLQQEFSDLKIGVGTVTSIQKMSLVTDEDFAFAVSPGFDPAMVNMADIANLPFCQASIP